MPMRNGCIWVASTISRPTQLAATPMGFAMRMASTPPTRIVTMGVTRISTFVSLLTALPNSEATMAMTSTASGPPAPPRVLAPQPTASSENSTRGGHCSA